MKTENEFRVMQIRKILMVLPLILIVGLALTSCGKSRNTDLVVAEIAPPPPPPPPPPPVPAGEDQKNEPFMEVDVMPEFPGGNAALLKYIGNGIVYPESAKTNSIQGKVLIRFSVESDGSISNASIFKGVNTLLDNEALRVVKTLPKFEPGLKDGKAVAVWYTVPIDFRLK